MQYLHIEEGRFISRPNRFAAQVDIDGSEHTVHVKNTGRCRELLTLGARVFLEKSTNRNRKTAYDLVAVYKDSLLINMDSQAPNRVFDEFLRQGGLFKSPVLIKPESKFQNSRFDFYAETKDKRIFLEVKGVTLESNGVAMFPDAPTERGVKHVKELISAKTQGFEAYCVFIIQMENPRHFTPNAKTHPQFAEALRDAYKAGVKLLAYDCRVTPDSLNINREIKIIL